MRRGVVLMEVIVGCGLLALFLAVCVQMLAATALQRRASEQRAIALQEAANVVERVSAMPYEDITSGRLAEIELSPDLERILPDVAAEVLVEQESGEVPSKRLSIQITWKGGRAQSAAPVRLTYWAYPRSQGTTP